MRGFNSALAAEEDHIIIIRSWPHTFYVARSSPRVGHFKKRFVGNAIKFTDTGEVAVKAEANNGSFHVSVRDTGPGISSADQARLLDRKSVV